MKPIWIIENLEQSFLELSEAAKELGHEVIDINRGYEHNLISKVRGKCVIFSGSIEMTKLVGNHLILQANKPSYYCNWKKYKCSAFYGKLGGYLFNDNHCFIPLAELNRRKYFFYGLFGKECLIFVRPDGGDKSFKGGLVDLQDFDSFYEEFKIKECDLVVVSSPKTIRGEWRFVVTSEKKILAQSSYRYQGQAVKIPSAPNGATDLCKKILDEGYFPDDVFCIDICEDNDGNFWLMELTSFSSAGLYAGDKKKIVEGVSEMATKNFIDR